MIMKLHFCERKKQFLQSLPCCSVFSLNKPPESRQHGRIYRKTIILYCIAQHTVYFSTYKKGTSLSLRLNTGPELMQVGTMTQLFLR